MKALLALYLLGLCALALPMPSPAQVAHQPAPYCSVPGGCRAPVVAAAEPNCHSQIVAACERRTLLGGGECLALARRYCVGPASSARALDEFDTCARTALGQSETDCLRQAVHPRGD